MHAICEQGAVPQAAASLRVPLHSAPPSSAGLRTWRRLSRWPPPQLPEQVPQSDHSAKRQGACLRSGLQPAGGCSPVRGRHISTSESRSWPQFFPRPLGATAMLRWRSLTPKQASEHSLHALQSPSWQSMSGRQEATSQGSKVSATPVMGRPQWFGCCVTSRCRDLKPLPQLAEHLLHADQLPQAPSRQAKQGWVLQTSTSLLFCGSHGLPPLLGGARTAWLRWRVPPPQEQPQALHSSQSPHSQSWWGHSCTSHGATSRRLPLKPAVQSSICENAATLCATSLKSESRRGTEPNVISRCRSRSPRLQLAEQADQSDQSITEQASAGLQACGLQGAVWESSLAAHAPPRSGCARSRRLR
mmetsp:Transcript_99975/g.283143  ORF Transcript_99975/g.283143 Transcript_99975/m.283143 type:complete len:359 (+) Transcript_99975:700-1776(+)